MDDQLAQTMLNMLRFFLKNYIDKILAFFTPYQLHYKKYIPNTLMVGWSP